MLFSLLLVPCFFFSFSGHRPGPSYVQTHHRVAAAGAHAAASTTTAESPPPFPSNGLFGASSSVSVGQSHQQDFSLEPPATTMYFTATVCHPSWPLFGACPANFLLI
uniref:Secreted protein n=1 Tax=Opuntia streptacantha TaxID=393608 RepID=A0A7C9DGN2_OPUST